LLVSLVVRVPEGGKTNGPGNELAKKLKQLRAHELGINVPRDPGDVTAWPSQTCNETGPDRIDHASHHNRNAPGGGGVPGRLASWRTCGHEHIQSQTNKLDRLLSRFVCTPLIPAVLDQDALALDVTQLTQFRPKFIVDGAIAPTKVTNPPHLPNLLRPDGARGERTGQRGQQEAAAVHPGMVGRAANQVKCTARLDRRGRPRPRAGPWRAPQSQAIQTTSPSTPASSSPQRRCSFRKASRSASKVTRAERTAQGRRAPAAPANPRCQRPAAWNATRPPSDTS
jgi:hypothetical protein